MTGLGVLVLLSVFAVLSLALLRGGDARGPKTRRRPRRTSQTLDRPTPGVAEKRALDLLRSVVNVEEWEMFSDLGFICVGGHSPARTGPGPYRYLVYPHLPVVALLPRSLAPVREYCIQFPDVQSERHQLLPVGDDVLAKWMTLRGDEDRMLSFANVTNAGCQVPIARIESDLERLRLWRGARGRLPPSHEHLGL